MFIITKGAFVWSAPKLKIYTVFITRALQWFKDKVGGQEQSKAWAFTQPGFLGAYIIKIYRNQMHYVTICQGQLQK